MQQAMSFVSLRARSRIRIGALSALVVGLFAVTAMPGTASAASDGFIEGKVTSLTSGEPLFAEVCAVETTTFDEFCTITDLDGEYEISAPAGNYKVSFFASGYLEQWYNGKSSFSTADVVEVEEGETLEHINAALVEAGGKISGRVTDATNGQPIQGIEVCADQTSGSFFGDCEITDSNGEYTLSFLSAGSYAVEFFSPEKYNESLEKWELEGPNFAPQWYNGKLHRQEADSVSVQEGHTSTGINASLQPGATITGTVTDALTGAVLQGVDVCAWGTGSQGFSCNMTDTNGNYSIPALTAGQYKVEFSPEYFFIKKPEFNKEYWQRTEYPLFEYLRQYWNDKFSFATAELVNATAGVTTPGISAKMTKEFEAPPAGIASVGAKAKVKGGKALLSLKCAGPGTCSGVVELRAKSKPQSKGKKKHKKGAKTVLIGKAKFSIAAGKSATVRVKLNGKGKSLVSQAGKKGLKATASGTGVKKGNVVLKGQAKKKKQKKGHH